MMARARRNRRAAAQAAAAQTHVRAQTDSTRAFAPLSADGAPMRAGALRLSQSTSHLCMRRSLAGLARVHRLQ